MSFRTTAQEKIDNAREHVKLAIADLGEIVVNECYGTDELSDEVLQTCTEVLQELIGIRRKL